MMPRKNTLNSVALLIPAYNCQEALLHTLSSLPTELALYILVVDDGSEPPISLPETINNHHIVVERKSKNSGIEDTLRLGTEILINAGAEYIARIDAGDVAINSRFIKQFHFLKKNKDVGVVGSYVQVVANWDKRPLFILTPPCSDKEIRRKIFFRSCYLHPAWMFRTSALIEAGGYRDKYLAAEDLDLFLRLMSISKVANIPEVLLICEMNDSGISSKKRNRQIISTLRLQLSSDFTGVYYLIGLIKNLIHFVVPYKVLVSLKQKLIGIR
jgi:glycosyltransferase involved in cell wall biosynthesis